LLNVKLDFAAVLAQWPMLLHGLWVTAWLTAVAVVIGLAIGIVCAWSRAQLTGAIGPVNPRLAPLAWITGGYVELIRNTPFIIQLFFIFFGLPSIGIKLSPEMAAVLAMVINLGAYSTEIVRAGFEATPKGQIEAAQSLGMSTWHMISRVVLPPALKKVWPAMVSQIIIVMLGSAVCGQIATQELSYAANLIQSRNFRAFESYMVVTLIYLAFAMALRQFLFWLGPKAIFKH
jgi:polar amino acid transport system permease protein